MGGVGGLTDRNRERGRGSGGEFSTQINNKLINNAAGEKGERERRKKADLTELSLLQIRVRSNAANLLLACKEFSSCSEEPTLMCLRFSFSFLFYSVQLQLYH